MGVCAVVLADSGHSLEGFLIPPAVLQMEREAEI